MFRNAKVGDRVWGFRHGWGTITSTSHLNVYPLFVLFDNGKQESFTIEGKVDNYDDKNPTLFWNEIKFEISEKSFNLENELRKLEIKKFEYDWLNYFLVYDRKDKEITYGYHQDSESPDCIYFSGKSIKRFCEKAKEQKITKEEFFRVYKNVFGGR